MTTFEFLLAAFICFICFCVCYLWRKKALTIFDIFGNAVNQWRTKRVIIIQKPRVSHRRKAETEQKRAKKSLVGGAADIFDVDKEAAIKNNDMQGESQELSQAGPFDTFNNIDTEPNPGAADLEQHNEDGQEGNNLDDLQRMNMGQPLYEPPAGIDDGYLPPPAPNVNSQESMNHQMSLSKVKRVVDNWTECIETTIKQLRNAASRLRSSHRTNAKAEHTSAVVSLVGDFIGLGGVVLAPFSGGASLALCGVSAATGIGSFFSKRDANKTDERIKIEINREVERATEQDRMATNKLNALFAQFTDLEQQLEVKRIGDILVSLQETSITRLNINARDIKINHLSTQLQQKDSSLCIAGLCLLKLKAALTSAEEVVKVTRVTNEVFRGTRTIRQVVSTAQSVNQISKTANSLSTAKQAAVLSLQAGQSVAKSTTVFASVAKGTDGVVKTVGAVSSATKSTRIAAEVVVVSGQAVSAAKTVTKAVKAGTAISTATKGADTTIKTVKNIKQASNTVKTVTQVATDTGKAVSTTRITTNAASVTKMTETATKAASISKVGLAINAVVIPLDIYNLVVASDNLNKSHEDVQRIEDHANKLEKEMRDIKKEFNGKVECFRELHLQLFQVYENHHIEVIYEYLQLMNEHLGLPLPMWKW